jgi:ESCRT-I complex subunit TSG101
LEDVAVQKSNVGDGEDTSNDNETTAPVDDVVQPSNALHGQMLLDLAAENAAISDALYFLDRGLYKGHVHCEVHLKQERRLAKRQFLVREHLIKIHQAMVVVR